MNVNVGEMPELDLFSSLSLSLSHITLVTHTTHITRAGLIRIVERDPRQEPHPFIDLNALKQTRKFIVRCYVLQARNLQPADRNGLADPYLRVRVKGGGKTINDSKNKIKNTLNPDFYRAFELEAALPGTSQLEVSVMDWDRFQVGVSGEQ